MANVLGFCLISMPVYLIVKVRKSPNGRHLRSRVNTASISGVPPPNRSSTCTPHTPINSFLALRSVKRQRSSWDTRSPWAFNSLLKRRNHARGASANPYAAFSRRNKSSLSSSIHFWISAGGRKYSCLSDGSPERKAVFISAPHIFHLRAAQIESIRFLDSFLSVGESVAMWPNSGSCHPTNTNRAFGVFSRLSGSDDFFQTSTHLALITLSRGIPRLLQSEVTLLSIHDCHSFFIATSNLALSSGLSFLKFTSTLRCFAAGCTVKQSSKTSQRHRGLSVISSARSSMETSMTSCL